MESLAVYWNSCSKQYATLPDKILFVSNTKIPYKAIYDIVTIGLTWKLTLGFSRNDSQFNMNKIYTQIHTKINETSTFLEYCSLVICF